MARFKRVNAIERRASRRVPASKVVPHGITRLATGQEVKLINISGNGAILINSNVVLLPGSFVRLKMKIPGSLVNLDGRIQRCRVIGLKEERIKYEAAIVLDGGLPQPLAETLRFLDEENPSTKTISLQDMNLGNMPLPDTAELWVLSTLEA
jgi:hypothetical protein